MSPYSIDVGVGQYAHIVRADAVSTASRLLDLGAGPWGATSILIGDSEPAQGSLLAMAGLGADIWDGVDAAALVAGLRDEWDPHR